MIRKLIFLLVILSSLTTQQAAAITQQTFRTKIREYLREEQLNPTIDSENNTIDFKYKGDNYWIYVGDDAAPFYVSVNRSGLTISDADFAKVLESCDQANRRVRFAKAYTSDNVVKLTCEFYAYSPEEFRYVFYKCLKELDNLQDAVKEAYNSDSSSSSGRSTGGQVNGFGNNRSGGSSSTGLGSIADWCPVYGLTLNTTTLQDLRNRGYDVTTDSDNDSFTFINGMQVWDFSGNSKIDSFALFRGDEMPQVWMDKGVNWRLSYNQFKRLFENMGYRVVVTSEPSTATHNGRKVFKAKFSATAPDRKVQVRLDFDGGNQNGEGYSATSPNTLNSITIDSDF